MRPGDRKKRWEQSCEISALIFFCFGLFFLFGVDGYGGIGIAVLMLLMAVFEFRDLKRGWKIKEGRPPWADRFEARDKKLDEELTELKMPGKYAFQDKPSNTNRE